MICFNVFSCWSEFFSAKAHILNSFVSPIEIFYVHTTLKSNNAFVGEKNCFQLMRCSTPQSSSDKYVEKFYPNMKNMDFIDSHGFNLKKIFCSGVLALRF
jgi:hypothetical protein